MSKIKVKFIQLFNPSNIQQMNPALQQLIDFPAKRAALKYDLGIKLNQAVNRALKDFETMRKKLCEDHSRVKEVKLSNGKKIETMMKIINAPNEAKSPDEWADRLITMIDDLQVTGKMILDKNYDIIDADKFQIEFAELLDTEIELDCYPVKLSRLELEEDCSVLDFSLLDPFIEDDRS